MGSSEQGLSGLAERLAVVQSGIDDATRAAGRTDTPTLIVVTKFHPAQLIEELFELGVRDIGENRHQEAQEKHAVLGERELTWHFLGQIQTKKARQVARYADVLHGVDRIRLVEALRGIERPLEVFVQVNLTDDSSRGGVAPQDLESLVESVLDVPELTLKGVMAVAPLDEEPARAFARLRGYSDRVRALDSSATAISAGMTHDYAEAIAVGATHLRIGTAITGNRPITG